MSYPLPPSMIADDATLAGLLLDRMRMQRQLAPLLTRVGKSHGAQRATLNHARSVKRKALRKALRANADAVSAYLLTLYTPGASHERDR